MAKRPVCVTIEETLADLSSRGKFNLNRSELLEQAIIIELQARLQTLEPDITSLISLANKKLLEEKKRQDALKLQGQRIEQEQYAAARATQELMKRDRQILAEWHNFCAGRRIPEQPFLQYICGDGDNRYAVYEDQMIQHFRRKGIPDDLNILRELLTKESRPVCRAVMR